MSIEKIQLTRVHFETHTTITGEKAGGKAAGIKVHASRYDNGVDSVRVTNGDFVFEVLPSRGMSVWKAWHKGEELGWRSPVQGPVHPHAVPVTEPSGLGWLDGFDELLVRCGLESNGAPEFDEQGVLTYPLHGRIGNKSARSVEVVFDGDAGTVAVNGVVDETRFHFLKARLHASIVSTAGENAFRVRDTVENLSAGDAEIQMLYHVNFGVPLLDAGSQLIAPISELTPRNDHAASGIGKWNHYEGAQAGFEEQVYFATLRAGKANRTEVLLKNAHSSRGVSLQYDMANLPCFTLWKNTTSVEDGYVTGIEPGTNYPNPRTYEGKQGTTIKLAGRAKTSFDMQVAVHATEAEIAQAERRISQIAGAAEPTIHNTPQPGWCSDVE